MRRLKLKIESGECSLKIEFEERSLKIQFEETRAFCGVGRGAQVGNLHLEVNCGARVDVGRIFFMVRFRPWDPTNSRFGRR